MAVFRVERNTGYTVMSNHHLRNKELTLKAKGLLSQMLSLPEDWDYTLAGLSYINRESIDAIRTAVWELEKAGYITRRQGRDEKGKMTAIEYTIYEQPQSPGSHSPGLENPTPGKPILENPIPGNPTSENPTQLNLDAALSSVDEEAKRLNTSVVAKQKRMRTLEKFIEHGSNYNRLKPIHDELKTLKNGWGKKREKFEQAHESDLIIWNAANRFLHANLPEGTKSFKVSEWQKEFDELKAQSTGEYEELKTKRSEVKELQQIRKCIDIVEQAEQRTQEQTHQTPRRKKEDISL